MNDKKKWNRRLAPHIYDYNYKVGESYYTPQTEYIENRELLRSRKQPPEAQSFAERYADRPIYGSTRGLPYDARQSELAKPLLSRRAQSLGRAGSRDRELDDISYDTRRGRSRERKVSFNVDDFLQKLSVDDALNFQEPVRRYPKSSRLIASEEDFDIKPKVKRELDEEFKRIKTEFKKADSLERGAVPRTTQYEETSYDSDLVGPRRRNVKREEVSYTLPPSGAKVRKSTYTETSKLESSKPPRAAKFSSITNFDDDLDFKPTRTSRLRKFSTSDIDDDNFSLKSRIPGSRGRNRTAEEEKEFSQGLSLRERRRAQESEQLSEHINSFIDKVKSHDYEDGYKFTRNIRASSLDPYEWSPRVKSRVQARAQHFTYGVSK